MKKKFLYSLVCAAFTFCEVVLVGYLLSCLLISCEVQSIPCSHENDSIKVQTRIDSIYIYERDSVFVDRYVKADTVFLTRTIERVKYKDAIRLQHDTIRTTETETIVQPQPYVPDYNKNCTRGFWVLLAILILLVGQWAIRKYLKLRTGGLIK